MTAGQASMRSSARAHLAQLIEMFGADGCLRMSTAQEPGAAGGAPEHAPDSGGPGDGEQP